MIDRAAEFVRACIIGFDISVRLGYATLFTFSKPVSTHHPDSFLYIDDK